MIPTACILEGTNVVDGVLASCTLLERYAGPEYDEKVKEDLFLRTNIQIFVAAELARRIPEDVGFYLLRDTLIDLGFDRYDMSPGERLAIAKHAVHHGIGIPYPATTKPTGFKLRRVLSMFAVIERTKESEYMPTLPADWNSYIRL